MALGGPINGREINRFPINGASGIIVVEMAADMSLSLVQTAALTRAHVLASAMGITLAQTAGFVRIRALVPYGITSFQSVLERVVRTQLLEPYGIVTIDAALQAMVKTQVLETDADIEIVQAADILLLPAMNSHQVIEFVFACAIDHAFFGHWSDGQRISVPAEDRGLRVLGEHRAIIVPPDPEPAPRIVRVPADYRRILVPRDPDELVPQKHRKVFA